MELQLSRPAPDDETPRLERRRPVLTLRDPRLECLIGACPIVPDDTDDLRGWARALTASASRWEIEKAKANAQDRHSSLFGGTRK